MATRRSQQDQAQQDQAQQDQAQQDQAAPVLAAVLAERYIDGVRYAPGQLLKMRAAQAAPYLADGTLDAAPGAVEYRRSLGEDVITHAPAPIDAPAAEPAGESG